MEAETETLLNCLRWDAASEERLSTLTSDDWSALWHLVKDGEAAHLLARRLAKSSISAPPEIIQSLRTHILSIAARNLSGRAALAKVIADTGRPALLLKGVDLAERIYGNLGLRPMGDVDVLIGIEDMDAYDEALRKAGYTALVRLSPATLSSRTKYHIAYLPKVAGELPIEIHWRLNNGPRDNDVDMDAIWSRAHPAPHIAPGAYVMDPEDMFLYLCMHLKAHTFEISATQILDIAECLSAPQFHLDWKIIWERAASWKLSESVKIAIYLASNTFGSDARPMCDWRPAPDLAATLPDPLRNLGRFPSPSDIVSHRLPILLSPDSSITERLRALREGALPPRAEIRASHGSPTDGFWGDCRSYVRRWSALWRARRGGLWRWFRGDPTVRSHVRRVAALRRHMDNAA